MNLPTLKKPSTLTLLLVLHATIIVLALVAVIRQKGVPPATSEKIMVIPIEGIISLDKDSMSGGLSVPEIVKTLEQAREKTDIKAIVLRINSPGGSVGAVQEIHRSLRKCKEKGKIIVSSFGDVAASGGYYVACAGDHIIANPGTLTGSIGVVMQLPTVEGLFQKIGVSVQTIKSGAMKDAGSPFRKLSPDERAYFTTVIMDAYDQFYNAVKESRKLDDAVLKPLADGRVFSGRMAMKSKLVDSLGGLEEAIEKAKELSGLKDKKPEIIFKEETRTLERLLRLISKTPLDNLKTMSRSQMQLMYVID